MGTCVCVCVCEYIYIYICGYIHTYVCVRVYVYTSSKLPRIFFLLCFSKNENVRQVGQQETRSNTFLVFELTQADWRKTANPSHPSQLYLILLPATVSPGPGSVLECSGSECPFRKERFGHSQESHYLHHYSCHPGLQTWSLNSCSQRDSFHHRYLRTDTNTQVC